MRLTVEQDVIFPFIPNDKVEEMKKEPIFQKYQIDAGNLTRGLVSCTGAQVGEAFATPCYVSGAGLPHCSVCGGQDSSRQAAAPLRNYNTHEWMARMCCRDT